MRGKLGGKSRPRLPDVVISPSENESGMRWCCKAGRSKPPRATMVIPEAPVNAVKTAQTRIAIIAKPPGSQPSRAWENDTNRAGALLAVAMVRLQGRKAAQALEEKAQELEEGQKALEERSRAQEEREQEEERKREEQRMREEEIKKEQRNEKRKEAERKRVAEERAAKEEQQKCNVPDAVSPATSSRQRLHVFFSKHNPEKLGDIDDILKRFAGREEEMFQKLSTKYNVPYEPQTCSGAHVTRFQVFFDIACIALLHILMGLP